MKNFRSWFAVAVVVALGAGSNPGSALAQSSMTYESLKDFPDFAGSWTPLGPPFVLAPATPAPQGAPPPRSGVCDLPPEFKAEVGARCLQAVQAPAPDFCAQPYFTGNPPRGAGGAFEILFTPGRITMAVESGLVRRIYLRDRPPAGALDVSRSGTSVGRWEGATLVVETTGLDPNAPVVRGSVLGPDARGLWSVLRSSTAKPCGSKRQSRHPRYFRHPGQYNKCIAERASARLPTLTLASRAIAPLTAQRGRTASTGLHHPICRLLLGSNSQLGGTPGSKRLNHSGPFG